MFYMHYGKCGHTVVEVGLYAAWGAKSSFYTGFAGIGR